MKNFLASLFIAVLVSSCAATSANTDGNDALRALQSDNDTLVQILVLNKLAERQSEFGLASPLAKSLSDQPTDRLAVQPFPKNLAKTEKTAEGCESGPEAIEIVNDSLFFLKLGIDGQDVTVLGRASSTEFVAPHQRIYLCSAAGEHVVAGTVYVARDMIAPRAEGAAAGELIELGTLEQKLTVGPESAAVWAVNTRDVILPASLR
ncbi:MAG: hypothetical protein WCT10_04370 [Patescibacteria group bacterium]|jgi:hypothetical protein